MATNPLDSLASQVVDALTQIDALRALVLEMLKASENKDAILVAFSNSIDKTSDILLDTDIADPVLESHRKAMEWLHSIARKSCDQAAR